MAIVVVDRGGTTKQSGTSTTLAFSPSGNFGSTSVALLSVSLNNTHSGGVAYPTFSVADSLGNLWLPGPRFNYDPGAANDGLDAGIFTCTQNVSPLTTGTTITMTVSTACQQWTMMLDETIPTMGKTLSVGTSGQQVSGANTNSISMTTGSITADALCFCAAGIEHGVDGELNPIGVTWDSDTTNGSWTSPGRITNTTSAGTGGMTVIRQYKVVSATATQTWDVSFNLTRDMRAGWIEITESGGTNRRRRLLLGN